MDPSVGPGSSSAVTARPADLGARKCHESGLRPDPVGGIRPDGGGRPDGGVRPGGGEAIERQKHSLYLYDFEDPPADEKGRPPELLGPRLTAAPRGWRCVTPGLGFPAWREPLDAAVPRGGHQA